MSRPSIAAPAAATSANTPSTVAAAGGFGHELHDELGDHAERALAADEAGDEIVAGDALRGAPPAAQHLAAHQADLEAQDVFARHAVLERARPAGVRRGVAADRAHVERCRIGRIEQAAVFDGGLQLAGHDAGLDDGHEIGFVDLFDALHLLGRQHDAALDRQRAADHARAGATRRDRHAALGADPQHGRDLLRRAAQRGARRRIENPAAGSRRGRSPRVVRAPGR